MIVQLAACIQRKTWNTHIEFMFSMIGWSEFHRSLFYAFSFQIRDNLVAFALLSMLSSTKKCSMGCSERLNNPVQLPFLILIKIFFWFHAQKIKLILFFYCPCEKKCWKRLLSHVRVFRIARCWQFGRRPRETVLATGPEIFTE